MTRLVDSYLACPGVVGIEEDRRRGAVNALVNGRFAFGPYLGMTYDEATAFDRFWQAELKKASTKAEKEIVLERAYYQLSEGKTLVELFAMWAWARTKQYGTIKITANFAQEDLMGRMWTAWETDTPFMDYIVKARQWGLSTTIQILFLLLGAHLPDITILTMAHKTEKTMDIWRMQKDCYAAMPYRPRVQFPKREMRFLLTGSRGRVESAEDKSPAHSSAYRLVHQSEVARFPNPDEIDEGVSATLPERGFFVWVKESTALGMGDSFHKGWELAEEGKSDWRATFYGWLGHPEYRRPLLPGEEAEYALNRLDDIETGLLALGASVEQLKWWRVIVATKFKGDVGRALRQFPGTPLDAFRGAGSSAFSSMGLARVAKWMREHPEKPKYEGNLLAIEPSGSALTRDPLYL